MADVAIVKSGEVMGRAQPQLTVDAWTRERIDLVKKTVCPQGIPDADFALFIEQCKRSGLDPLLKEAFCVKRRQNIGTKDKPNWIDKYEFQPAETGFLSRAEQFPDYRGVTAAAVYSKDAIEIDAGEGVVRHKFSPTAQRGQLLGAWARLERDGKQTVVVWLELGGYQQNTPMWGKIGPNMMEKCARVAALRKGYPGPFGGLYIAEERTLDEAREEALTAAPAALPEATTITPPKTAAEAKAQLERKVAAINAQAQVVDAPAKPHRKMQIEDVSAKPATPPVNPCWTRILAIAEEHGMTVEQTKQEMKSRFGKTKPADITEADVQAFAKWIDDSAEPPPDAQTLPPPPAEPVEADVAF